MHLLGCFEELPTLQNEKPTPWGPAFVFAVCIVYAHCIANPRVAPKYQKVKK
jgi:hypothetical protein